MTRPLYSPGLPIGWAIDPSTPKAELCKQHCCTAQVLTRAFMGQAPTFAVTTISSSVTRTSRSRIGTFTAIKLTSGSST